MSSDIRPLPIYPWPLSQVDMGAIRLAKSRLDVDWKVFPRPAVPGSPGRILAFRERPNFICEHALVHDPQNGESLVAALKWATGMIEDERATTVVDMLQSIFGEGVREITEEELLTEEEAGPPMPNFTKAFDLNDQRKVAFR